jgi:hypothetical protein
VCSLKVYSRARSLPQIGRYCWAIRVSSCAPVGRQTVSSVCGFRLSRPKLPKLAFRRHKEPQLSSTSYRNKKTDRVLRFLRVNDDQLLPSCSVDAVKAWVSITPEGYFAASDVDSRPLSVVHGLESYSIDQFYDALHPPDLVREKLVGDPRGLVRAAAAKLDLSKVMASGSAPRVTIV